MPAPKSTRVASACNEGRPPRRACSPCPGSVPGATGPQGGTNRNANPTPWWPVGAIDKSLPPGPGPGLAAHEAARGARAEGWQRRHSVLRAAALGIAARRGPQPSAEQGECRVRATRDVFVLRDRDTPATALRSAARRCPPPARLRRVACSSVQSRRASGGTRWRSPLPAEPGMATAGRERHVSCSSLHDRDAPAAPP